jgi:hypothetical protein
MNVMAITKSSNIRSSACLQLIRIIAAVNCAPARQFLAPTVAIADNEHPDHQLGINRRPSDLAVEGPQLRAQLSQ